MRTIYLNALLDDRMRHHRLHRSVGSERAGTTAVESKPFRDRCHLRVIGPRTVSGTWAIRG